MKKILKNLLIKSFLSTILILIYSQSSAEIVYNSNIINDEKINNELNERQQNICQPVLKEKCSGDICIKNNNFVDILYNKCVIQVRELKEHRKNDYQPMSNLGYLLKFSKLIILLKKEEIDFDTFNNEYEKTKNNYYNYTKNEKELDEKNILLYKEYAKIIEQEKFLKNKINSYLQEIELINKSEETFNQHYKFKENFLIK